MTQVFVYQALFLYLPYVLALSLALRARSRAARMLVVIVAFFMLLALIAVTFLSDGCTSTDLMLQDCPRVGPSFTFALSLASLWLLMAHFVLMPILALVALVLEWRARRAR